jgi:hypothetical protein
MVLWPEDEKLGTRPKCIITKKTACHLVGEKVLYSGSTAEWCLKGFRFQNLACQQFSSVRAKTSPQNRTFVFDLRIMHIIQRRLFWRLTLQIPFELSCFIKVVFPITFHPLFYLI